MNYEIFMKKNLTTFAVIFIIISLSIAVILLRKHRMTDVELLANIGEAPWALNAASVTQGTLSRGFPVLATLSGSKDITISSQISGAIESMGPREGVKVIQGELLAQISVAELKQQRAGLEAQRQTAIADQKRTQDELVRQRQLKKKGLTTQELLESKEAAAIASRNQVLNIDKQLAAMDVRINYGAVYAPQDAIVASRLMEPGDITQPGKALYRLTVNSTARLKVSLPQQILEQVHEGTPVLLTYGGAQQQIRLSRIFPALDAYALGNAEADLSSMPFTLPSGARIPASVILASLENALVIPHRAIVRTGDAGFLFRVIKGDTGLRLQRIKVKILLEGRDGLAIEGNINAGDKIIVAHQSVLMQLKDNDSVTLGAGDDS